MRLLLLGALWIHLAASVGLVGSFFMLLVAGPPRGVTARGWDDRILRWARVLLLIALGSGILWLLLRTASFENRPGAALEPRAVLHVLLDTWPGVVWLARHGLFLLLGVFLAVPTDVTDKSSWIAARGQALLLSTLALGLISASSHAAAVTPGTATSVATDVMHLVGTGFWAGGLVPLGLLLRLGAREGGADALPFAVIAARRFSRAALVLMLVLCVSGVANALTQIETIAALLGTAHGRLLLAKLAVLVPILGIAAVNRTHILPALAAPRVARRLAVFVTVEAGLALTLLALAAAMTLTTPARHAEPVWPLPFRISVEALLDVDARRRALVGSQLAVLGMVVLGAALVVRRRRPPALVAALGLVVVGIGIGLPPLVVDAYPTTYRRPSLTYHVTSIASGMTVYREHCAACHGPTGAGAPPVKDLRGPATSRRHAGELFWLVTHGVASGMPAFADRLTERQRWDVINFIRALAAAEDAKRLGPDVEPDKAWLVPPDFTVAVGPLAPGALRDHRGRRMVLVVLYTLPGSRPRLNELARSYDVLSVLGVEIIAVPMHASTDALAELRGSPPILFPVVTEGAADIAATYRMLAPGPHAELLVDRQGYIRAIWRDGAGAVAAQVEKLNAEKDVPPFPDDHVH